MRCLGLAVRSDQVALAALLAVRDGAILGVLGDALDLCGGFAAAAAAVSGGAGAPGGSAVAAAAVADCYVAAVPVLLGLSHNNAAACAAVAAIIAATPCLPRERPRDSDCERAPGT